MFSKMRQIISDRINLLSSSKAGLVQCKFIGSLLGFVYIVVFSLVNICIVDMTLDIL